MGKRIFKALKPGLGLEELETRWLFAIDFRSADFNADLRVDANDLDQLVMELRSGIGERRFDLNEDGSVDDQDVDFLLSSLLNTRRGDADLDGDVDFADFLTLSLNFRASNVGWAGGDFGGREGVDFEDFLLQSRNFGFQSIEPIYTHFSADGNRYIPGWANLEETPAIDVELGFVAEWVLAADVGGDLLWFALANDGQSASGFVDAERTPRENNTSLQATAGVPPALLVSDTARSLVPPELSDRSVPSHPVVSVATQQVAYINSNAELVVDALEIDVVGGDESVVSTGVFQINALPDSRILTDDGGRFLVLTDPTGVYPHGIFGDRIEPSSFTIVDTTTSPATVNTISMPANHVIESLIPTWIDIDDDGEREIIVTISDLTNGGQVTIYNEQGEVESQGPGIGRTFRWRHQIAVAPFGPSGEIEFVDVLTPHIGGVVEFRALQEELPIVARVPGYTSHVNRTPNLDLAMAADFDSDGVVELLLPNQRRDQLAAISRTEEGAHVDWQLDLGARLTTNVGLARSQAGRISVVAGLSNGNLRVWRD